MKDFCANAVAGVRLIGTFAEIPHPVAIEVMAQAKPDFICIDWEHGQIARDTIENLVRACDVHGVPTMVRVPGHAPEAIAAALDSGARGILVPRVSTATQAAAAVKASRYPPLGERGVGPGRAAGYGYRIFDYLAEANQSIVVAVQVETAEGLANVDAIAATAGVDVVLVGPGDLSVSLDAYRPESAQKLAKAIGKIIATTLKHGKTSGIFCGRPDDVAAWAAKGVSFFILASDTMFLGAATASGLADARKALKPAKGKRSAHI
ncbi:aldolase/citrate lyase family protein [Mesorhizobium sp. KR9-304]|uniref:HpcH/HpaI aldolase family protein n=1 Tax=Mesorhizobium sp. KR9-304 TaxID=3156614 RepID=UPI0032B46589